jgi:GR25 family glycosyltransferase involved in LPS biosynthesis
MKSLFCSYNMNVSNAYIIRIVGNTTSEKKASRCANSCNDVGMLWKYWDAYNGISNPIEPPSHHSGIMKMIKVTDHYLTRSEVACALSHISLWAKCVEDDTPIVILEHDAVMLNKYEQHSVFNSIGFLGSKEQVVNGWQVLPTPPHSAEGHNYHFLCRAHAYAIDPAVAKNMLAHVLKFGICAPLDIIIRADIFPIHQMGIFAYDIDDNETTITNRATAGRLTTLNQDLSN